MIDFEAVTGLPESAGPTLYCSSACLRSIQNGLAELPADFPVRVPPPHNGHICKESNILFFGPVLGWFGLVLVGFGFVLGCFWLVLGRFWPVLGLSGFTRYAGMRKSTYKLNSPVKFLGLDRPMRVFVMFW